MIAGRSRFAYRRLNNYQCSEGLAVGGVPRMGLQCRVEFSQCWPPCPTLLKKRTGQQAAAILFFSHLICPLSWGEALNRILWSVALPLWSSSLSGPSSSSEGQGRSSPWSRRGSGCTGSDVPGWSQAQSGCWWCVSLPATRGAYLSALPCGGFSPTPWH